MKIVDGEPVLSTEELALVIGITADEILAEYQRQGMNPATLVMPKDWLRRAKERATRVGGTSLHDTLRKLQRERDILASYRLATPPSKE